MGVREPETSCALTPLSFLTPSNYLRSQRPLDHRQCPKQACGAMVMASAFLDVFKI